MRELEIDMMKILEDYKDDIEKIADADFQRVAKETVKELKSTSPKERGDYARGWSIRKTRGFNDKMNYIVYNKHAGLTHLLEKGHAVKPSPKHGGKKDRVEARPHIKPAEENAKNKLLSLLENDL